MEDSMYLNGERKEKRGRPAADIDTDVLFDLLESGASMKDAAEELNVSIPTLSKRIALIQRDQGLILQYRSLQNLQLTALQQQILERITPQKIEEASLRDLVTAYKILKDKELVEVGKPTEIKGMMHCLIELEKQQMAVKEPVEGISDADVLDLEEGRDFSRKDLTEEMPDI